uniref:tRNA (uracil-O(2)-)-methyltransferase n=1 Tax=Phallusia mammillata TaxID=59560 RepID=A0A6F9DV07_9ASCI|nr:probable tRNA (uracil-O(2)-)-methyltransferase [Phallusia mammillata]
MKPTYLILYHQCDKQQGSYIFMYVLQSKTLDEKNIDSVNCQSHLKDCFVTEDWLRSVLMPTLVKWCNDDQTNNSKLPPSHSLINQERYSILYHELKKKYGLHLAKIWPEVTDPQKFVYEDVAIATYLIVVWETERQQLGTSHKLQSFIDLGCGNGLLVHILSSEGYPGKGVDIKRRKIWDIYGGATCLEETTVTPNDQELVAGYDWILGNHSDELTPWIPIMAARSSYHTRYWVLPCCFFDLYSKFERRQSTQGQYHDYLGYVEQVARICGFDVEVDVMRIPSTKRVCHLGMRRLYQESNQQETLKNISNFVQSSETQSFNHEFAARPKDQKVRNCTKMDRNVQNEIVNKLTKHLLETVNLRKKGSGGNWNCGGSMPLNKAIELLDFSLTDMMKNECGGLQTLLRNHHQVFKVSKGCVSIRDWSDVDQSKHRKKGKPSGQICVKTKLCWFHMNHPDGCPRSANKCSFAHGKEDQQFISK